MRLAYLFPVFACLFFVSVQGASAQDKRKLIVLPGIVGSVLSDKSGDVVWGRAGSLLKGNFNRLNLLPVGRAPDDLRATDILRDVPLLLGSISVGFYGPMIDELTKVQTGRAISAAMRGKRRYEENQNLFVFWYDWRRSNFANAKRLNEFIRTHIPADEQFDVIAHSMGGLVTRIFLSEVRPSDVCTDAAVPTTLDEDERAALCHAIYGEIGGGTWPTNELGAAFDQAPRLHTFMEIAVPHRGSVNVASTFANGWGLPSDLFLGGKRPVQQVALSFVTPWELAPTYDNCCARGLLANRGNPFPIGKANEAVAKLDREFWTEQVLGFGLPNCPYMNCALKRQVVEIGLGNRALIDEVIDVGLPDTVADHHVLVGRYVGNTYDTVYVAHDSHGDGDKLELHPTVNGDGTVAEWSADAEEGNKAYASRSKHAFIVGNSQVTHAIKNVFIDPISQGPQFVSDPLLEFAGGFAEIVTLDMEASFIRTHASMLVSFQARESAQRPFARTNPGAVEVLFSFEPYDGTAITASATTGLSDLQAFQNGVATFNTMVTAPQNSGIYALVASSDGRELLRDVVYVMGADE